jgi:hypothetical protein
MILWKSSHKLRIARCRRGGCLGRSGQDARAPAVTKLLAAASSGGDYAGEAGVKKPRPIRIGDKVRVLKVPPSVAKEMPAETRRIFRRCVGKVLRVDGFGRYGHLELNVNDDGSQATPTAHTIWIEPECVEVVKAARRRQQRRGLCRSR